jgi:hypothetical protein
LNDLASDEDNILRILNERKLTVPFERGQTKKNRKKKGLISKMGLGLILYFKILKLRIIDKYESYPVIDPNNIWITFFQVGHSVITLLLVFLV